MDRDALISLFERAIDAAEGFERKGKANPYTSANGHMFSQINKDDQLGIRLPKTRQAALLEAYGAGPFKSYGATMRDYVCLTEEMDFPRFDGQFLIYRTGCFHAENEEPVPCGIQGAYCCAGPIGSQRREFSARV